ncbi:MAG: LPS assembly protein LptD [Desulfocapsaceae bacterium]|nr:LPS assembly protein LptD [Desulfocapsaceae bacterium]
MFLPQSTIFKCSLSLCIALAPLAYLPSAFAENANTEEWQITADRIIRYDNPESIVAEGNIQLIKREKVLSPAPPKAGSEGVRPDLLKDKPQTAAPVPADSAPKEAERFETKATIKADWMVYDVALGTIKLRGHVDIVSGEERLVAEHGVVDLSKDTGTFADATVTLNKNSLHLEGKSVEKTGVRTYHIVSGWAITCKVDKGETPPWSFASSDATVTQGGYALMKNTTFNIRGIPVFYTPYMVIPAKDTRESGFLFPEVSHSTNNGYGFILPFFYNISDSADATFFSEYYQNRGFMPGAEFRYVLGDSDKGTIAASFLHDSLSAPAGDRTGEQTSYYNNTQFTHTNSDRYWLRGKMDKSFGDSVIVRLDLDIVSDRDYLTEFNSGGYTGFNEANNRFLQVYGRGFQDASQDQRENSIGVLKTWTGMSLVTNVLAINDVRVPTSGPSPLWQLPGVGFSGVTPIRNSRFDFSWDANYVDYWRQDGIGAQRLDLYPRISTPLPLGNFLESRAEIGARETFYDVTSHGDSLWDQGDSPSRTLYNFHTDIGTTLARDYDVQAGDFHVLNHKIRPYVQYDYLPDSDQTALPYFDSIDRIQPANTITYGINNFFNLFKNSANRDFNSNSELTYIKIKQSYYLGDVRKNILYDSNNNPLPTDETNKALSPIDTKFGWKLTPNLDIIYQDDLDVYGHGFLLHSLGGSYRTNRGDTFSLDYSYNKLLDVEQINFQTQAQLFSNIRGEFLISRSLSQSQTNNEYISLIYQAACWSVQIRSAYTPTDSSIMLIFNLANMGTGLPISL